MCPSFLSQCVTCPGVWCIVQCVMTPEHPGFVLPLGENLAGFLPWGRAKGWVTEALGCCKSCSSSAGTPGAPWGWQVSLSGGAGTPQPGAVIAAFSASRAAAAAGEGEAAREGKVSPVVLTEVANCLGRPCLHILRLLLSLLLPH